MLHGAVPNTSMVVLTRSTPSAVSDVVALLESIWGVPTVVTTKTAPAGTTYGWFCSITTHWLDCATGVDGGHLYLSSVAHVLMSALRRLALSGTELPQAQCHKLRLKPG